MTDVPKTHDLVAKLRKAVDGACCYGQPVPYTMVKVANLKIAADELDKMAAELAQWRGIASIGNGSPCYTPERLEKELTALIAERAQSDHEHA
jgi:hypothetical protein